MLPRTLSNRKFRILALDGGGIRGLITARILQDLEKQIDCPINEYFDLIAGTSTGSILAAGLVMGMKPAKLIEIYQNRGTEIFPNTPWNWPRKKLLSWVYGAKYSNQGLKKVLQEEFQQLLASKGGPPNYNLKFGEIHQRCFGQIDPSSTLKRATLLILAHNTVQRQTTFFVSPSVDTPAPWYADRELWEICLSSAAAPTFFPPYCFNNEGIAIAPQQGQQANADQGKSYKAHTYIDGGVSANTPSLAALIHAIDIENQPLDNIALLSIGTGKTTKPYEYQQIRHWGALGWVNALADVFMGSQIQISADLCDQLLYAKTECGPDAGSNYLRLQFPLNKRLNQAGEFLPAEEQYNHDLYHAYKKKLAMARKTEAEIKQAAKVSEAMDDASPQTLAKLLDATEAFLNSSEAYRGQENVQAAIATWIATASKPKFTSPLALQVAARPAF